MSITSFECIHYTAAYLDVGLSQYKLYWTLFHVHHVMRAISTAPKNLNSFEDTSQHRWFRVAAVHPDAVYYFNSNYYIIR